MCSGIPKIIFRFNDSLGGLIEHYKVIVFLVSLIQEKTQKAQIKIVNGKRHIQECPGKIRGKFLLVLLQGNHANST